MEDVAFEIYSKNLWPSIETYFIEEKIVRYKLIKKKIINLNKDFLFNRFLKKIRY